MIAGGDLAPFGGGLVGDRGDAVGFGGPLLAPGAIGVGFAVAGGEPLPDAIDFRHGDGSVRHHALDDLHGVAPAQIAGKVHCPAALIVGLELHGSPGAFLQSRCRPSYRICACVQLFTRRPVWE
jgi:hypothetical protein